MDSPASAQLALRLAAIPASEAAVERAFSELGQILEKIAGGMLNETAESESLYAWIDLSNKVRE
jgi:hypothetical protein